MARRFRLQPAAPAPAQFRQTLVLAPVVVAEAAPAAEPEPEPTLPEWLPVTAASVVNTGSGTLTFSFGLFTSTGASASGDTVGDPFNAPSGNHWVITPPTATSHTGRVRVTLMTASMSSPYDHVMAQEVTGGVAVPVGEYVYDFAADLVGGLLPDLYIEAGVQDGGGGDGQYQFVVAFEGTP